MKKNISYILLILIIINIALSMYYFSKQASSKEYVADIETVRNLANIYLDKKLYDQAVEEYQTVLDRDLTLNPNQRANILFKIADIYQNKIFDYKNALKYYLRIKNLYPDSNLMSNVNKNIIKSLENLGQTRQAQLELDKITNLKSVDKIPPGSVIVAQVGDKAITQKDINQYIDELPEMYKANLNNKEERMKFLQQYVVEEILYNSAVRKGYDKEPEIQKKVNKIKRQVILQKILQEEVFSKVNITKDEVELYYKANKDDFFDTSSGKKVLKPIKDVQQEIMQKLSRKKQEQKYQEFIQKIMKAQNVQIYPENIK